MKKSSQALLKILEKSETLQNLQMTRVKHDKEEQGKIRIEEWYEMTGSIGVPEGSKSFWVISKESSEKEPFNFFMRLDRNMTASDYDNAQTQALDWVNNTIIKPIQADFVLEDCSINPPEKLSTVSKS